MKLSYVLARPALSQIILHLIFIIALQGDSFHFTEEETEAPAGEQLGRGHIGREWPSWGTNVGLCDSESHQPQPPPLLPNGV